MSNDDWPFRVYLLTMEGIYDHGTGGVFSTHGAADAHARELWDDSDHHHSYRINEIELDSPVWIDARGLPENAQPPYPEGRWTPAHGSSSTPPDNPIRYESWVVTAQDDKGDWRQR